VIRPDGDLDRLSDGVIAAVDGWRSAAEQANGAGSGDLPRRLARLDKRVVRLFRTEG